MVGQPYRLLIFDGQGGVGREVLFGKCNCLRLSRIDVAFARISRITRRNGMDGAK